MEKELSKNEVEILNLFRKNLFIKKTIREISLILKKHYPRTYDSVKNLERKEILKIKKIGNSNVCEINLSQKTISSLSYLDEQEAIDLNIPNLKKVVDFKEFFDEQAARQSVRTGNETRESASRMGESIRRETQPRVFQRLRARIPDGQHEGREGEGRFQLTGLRRSARKGRSPHYHCPQHRADTGRVNVKGGEENNNRSEAE